MHPKSKKQIQLWIDPEFHAIIKGWAQAFNMPVTQFCIKVLSDNIKVDELTGLYPVQETEKEDM